MIEKAIASALEPIVDEVIRLERKLQDIEMIEGPAGPAGADGKDAEPVDVEAIKRDVLSEIVLDDIVKQMVEAHNAKAMQEINAIFN
jgi:hypothetical protein